MRLSVFGYFSYKMKQIRGLVQSETLVGQKANYFIIIPAAKRPGWFLTLRAEKN